MIAIWTAMLCGMLAYSYGGKIGVFGVIACLACSIAIWFRRAYRDVPIADPDRDMRQQIYERHRR